MSLNVVEFPKNNLADIPLSLRNLADAIEKGEHGPVENLVWVMEKDHGDYAGVSVGMLGTSPSPHTTAYYLLGVGQRNLEQVQCPSRNNR